MVSFKHKTIDEYRVMVSFKHKTIDECQVMVSFKHKTIDAYQVMVSFKHRTIDAYLVMVSFKHKTIDEYQVMVSDNSRRNESTLTNSSIEILWMITNRKQERGIVSALFFSFLQLTKRFFMFHSIFLCFSAKRITNRTIFLLSLHRQRAARRVKSFAITRRRFSLSTMSKPRKF